MADPTTGAMAENKRTRKLSTAVSLDVKYKVEVADVTTGNSIAATLTTSKSAFESAMTTGMTTAIL